MSSSRILAIAALSLLLVPSAVSAADAEAAATRAAEGATGPGASVELKTNLREEPDIWTVLRAQYEVPTHPVALPPVTGLRSAPARLTLREAVLTAVKNNPGVIAASLSPLAEESGILGAQAQFDPLFSVDAGWGRAVEPQGTALAGASTLTQINSNWDASLSKLLRSGGQLQLAWRNRRFNTDSVFFDLAPQFKPELEATLNQPLLRGFGLYFTSLRIHLAERATEAAVERYKAAVADFILRLVGDYWAVVGLEERLGVLQGSLELAEKTVRDNRTRVQVGVLPPVAVLESEAEAARRKEDVIKATNDLEQARRSLRQEVYLPSDAGYFPQAVLPVDRPTSEKIEVAVEEAIRIALERRPEVRAARLDIESGQLNVALNENQLLPKVDVFGSIGLNSLAGTETNRNPFLPSDGSAPDTPFQGGYGDALNSLVDGRFYSYAVGAKIEIPIANAAARSAAERARVEHQQAYDRFRQVVSDVSLEVGQAAGDVATDLERIETTRIARELSEENLRNQTKRYEVGMVTTTDLLKFQNDLAAARVAEIQALIAYNISRTKLERAEGTLLSRFDVEVAARRPTRTPWWAKF